MFKRAWLWLFLLVAVAPFASAQSKPAFLDKSDSVTAWCAEPFKTSLSMCMVMVGGEVVPIVSASVSEPTHETDRAFNPNMVNFPGTIQSAIGGREWSPSDTSTEAKEVSPGRYEWVGKLPAGEFLYKLAKGGNWDENYGANFERGGANIVIRVPAGGKVVKIVADFKNRWIKDSISNPTEIQAPTTFESQSKTPESGPCVVRLKLKRPLGPTDIIKPMTLHLGNGGSRPIFARDALTAEEYVYTGAELGAVYRPGSTTFTVWSPVSTKVKIQIGIEPARLVSMSKGAHGTWSITMLGDWHAKPYRYQFFSYGQSRFAPDIYCRAASPDGQFSYVVDPKRTSPTGWPGPKLPTRRSAVDAVIYETHVRDLTVHPSSGVRADWRGKYLGLTQTGTSNGSQKTGLDYLADLGVTDIHLLPFQNFNPGNSKVYNWGYETNLFNMPEEQYATDPNDPIAPIIETKQMIAAMHRANLRIVMDVVYNHTVPSEGPGSAFEQSVPYYYFRTNDQGKNLNESGVGNAMHDEHPMARKYIKDSLEYWAREYNVDGFRFDLMGMFVPDTMAAIAKRLRAVRPDIVIYGEPWTGGGPNRFAKGAQRGLHIGVFNDQIRDAIRGEVDGPGKGFASGGGNPDQLQLGIVGSVNYSDKLRSFADAPEEAINYVSAHDNMCLVDKLAISTPKELLPNAVKLAGACVLLSQGVPFLEGGAEIGRTKMGNRNSYDGGDKLNQFRWDLASSWSNVQAYYKGLIAIRRAQPLFRLATAEEIRQKLAFMEANQLPVNTIAFTLKDPKSTGWKNILVILHGSTQPSKMNLPAGEWQIAADGDRAKNGPLYTATESITVKPLSAMVMYQ